MKGARRRGGAGKEAGRAKGRWGLAVSSGQLGMIVTMFALHSCFTQHERCGVI